MYASAAKQSGPLSLYVPSTVSCSHIVWNGSGSNLEKQGCIGESDLANNWTHDDFPNSLIFGFTLGGVSQVPVVLT